MSDVPAGSGKSPSPPKPEKTSPESTKPPSENTPNTPPSVQKAMRAWDALDALIGSALWAIALVVLFELWPKDWGNLGVRFAVILFLVFTLRGARYLHGQYKNILVRQGLYIDHLEYQVGFRGMIISFLHNQMNILAENAILGRIRELLEHTPVEDVKLVFESPEKLIIRLSAGKIAVDIDYNELAKDFEGTVNNAKEEFLDKYHAED